MSIPDYQSIMLPLLQLVSDGNVYPVKQAVSELANYYNLSEEEITKLLPSGTQSVFSNRVHWANSYLKKAGLISAPRYGHIQITAKGLDVLSQNPERIDVQYLKQFPELLSWYTGRNEESLTTSFSDEIIDETPQAVIAVSYKQIRESLKNEILEHLLEISSTKFEHLVVEVLVRMGYGTGEAIGRSGDGGIDGVIFEDKLGLDIVYIQAKRWEGTVGRPEIQRFAGALQERRARKGVFITTSDYSSEAKNYVDRIDTRIVLVNGEQLASFMIDYNVGVSITEVYEIKRVDSDYFEE